MSEALAPGTRLGPYEIVGLIGAGGMGQVYRALDPRLGRHVAIKTLQDAGVTDEDRVRRFETERVPRPRSSVSCAAASRSARRTASIRPTPSGWRSIC